MRRAWIWAVAALAAAGCGGTPGRDGGAGGPVAARGSVEVTARLVEVPEGAIFKRDLYDYAAILKYEVAAVHRGAVAPGAVIYVGHYDPWKPRAEAADARVKGVGGNVRAFRAGDRHRMALETPLDDFFMGGVVDKYFGKREGDAYWAVWTDDAG